MPILACKVADVMVVEEAVIPSAVTLHPAGCRHRNLGSFLWLLRSWQQEQQQRQEHVCELLSPAEGSTGQGWCHSV